MPPEGLLSASEVRSVSREDPARQFNELAAPLYGAVYQFVARQISSEAEAADVAQQAFIQAFRSFHRFDTARPFAPWLYRIARRAIADHYRRRAPASEELVHERHADGGPDPREQACAHEWEGGIWQHARQLKPKFYQVLLLHYGEDFSVADVATAMGLTVPHVKVLLFRARAALKRRLESTGMKGGSV